MKVTVDIPDDLLTAAKELACRLGWSLDRLCYEALREYVAASTVGRVAEGTGVAPEGPSSADILSSRGSLRGIDTSVPRGDGGL